MAEVKFEGSRLSEQQSDAIRAATLVEGARTSTWFARQSEKFIQDVMGVVRTSMENGESASQTATRLIGGTVAGVRVPGLIRSTRAQASAVASTAMTAVNTNARLATFQKNSDIISAIRQLSTFDNRTSDICIAYSGAMWDVETLQPLPPTNLPFNGGPPRHFNCRSTVVPVVKSFEELGVEALRGRIPPGTRASMDGQVPADLKFDQWLRTRSPSFQDRLLGPARANLWRNGDITLTQLVDFHGNPLTLDQLEEFIVKKKTLS